MAIPPAPSTPTHSGRAPSSPPPFRRGDDRSLINQFLGAITQEMRGDLNALPGRDLFIVREIGLNDERLPEAVRTTRERIQAILRVGDAFPKLIGWTEGPSGYTFSTYETGDHREGFQEPLNAGWVNWWQTNSSTPEAGLAIQELDHRQPISSAVAAKHWGLIPSDANITTLPLGKRKRHDSIIDITIAGRQVEFMDRCITYYAARRGEHESPVVIEGSELGPKISALYNYDTWTNHIRTIAARRFSLRDAFFQRYCSVSAAMSTVDSPQADRVLKKELTRQLTAGADVAIHARRVSGNPNHLFVLAICRNGDHHAAQYLISASGDFLIACNPFNPSLLIEAPSADELVRLCVVQLNRYKPRSLVEALDGSPIYPSEKQAQSAIFHQIKNTDNGPQKSVTEAVALFAEADGTTKIMVSNADPSTHAPKTYIVQYQRGLQCDNENGTVIGPEKTIVELVMAARADASSKFVMQAIADNAEWIHPDETFADQLKHGAPIAIRLLYDTTDNLFELEVRWAPSIKHDPDHYPINHVHGKFTYNAVEVGNIKRHEQLEDAIQGILHDYELNPALTIANSPYLCANRVEAVVTAIEGLNAGQADFTVESYRFIARLFPTDENGEYIPYVFGFDASGKFLEVPNEETISGRHSFNENDLDRLFEVLSKDAVCILLSQQLDSHQFPCHPARTDLFVNKLQCGQAMISTSYEVIVKTADSELHHLSLKVTHLGIILNNKDQAYYTIEELLGAVNDHLGTSVTLTSLVRSGLVTPLAGEPVTTDHYLSAVVWNASAPPDAGTLVITQKGADVVYGECLGNENGKLIIATGQTGETQLAFPAEIAVRPTDSDDVRTRWHERGYQVPLSVLMDLKTVSFQSLEKGDAIAFVCSNTYAIHATQVSLTQLSTVTTSYGQITSDQIIGRWAADDSSPHALGTGLSRSGLYRKALPVPFPEISSERIWQKPYLPKEIKGLLSTFASKREAEIRTGITELCNSMGEHGDDNVKKANARLYFQAIIEKLRDDLALPLKAKQEAIHFIGYTCGLRQDATVVCDDGRYQKLEWIWAQLHVGANGDMELAFLAELDDIKTQAGEFTGTKIEQMVRAKKDNEHPLRGFHMSEEESVHLVSAMRRWAADELGIRRTEAADSDVNALSLFENAFQIQESKNYFIFEFFNRYNAEFALDALIRRVPLNPVLSKAVTKGCFGKRGTIGKQLIVQHSLNKQMTVGELRAALPGSLPLDEYPDNNAPLGPGDFQGAVDEYVIDHYFNPSESNLLPPEPKAETVVLLTKEILTGLLIEAEIFDGVPE